MSSNVQNCRDGLANTRAILSTNNSHFEEDSYDSKQTATAKSRMMHAAGWNAAFGEDAHNQDLKSARCV